jgi:hypothetical protein
LYLQDAAVAVIDGYFGTFWKAFQFQVCEDRFTAATTHGGNEKIFHAAGCRTVFDDAAGKEEQTTSKKDEVEGADGFHRHFQSIIVIARVCLQYLDFITSVIF